MRKRGVVLDLNEIEHAEAYNTAGNPEVLKILDKVILTLGIEQLMSMVLGLQVLNVKSSFGTTRGISKFLQFFLGGDLSCSVT